MDRKSICSLLCAMMLAILLISCNDKDDYDGLSPAELSGTYSNKLSAPANGDSLILSYNGNTFIGKDVEFKTDDGKTAHIILKYVLPHDKETAISGVSLTAGSGSYSFSGGATTSTGTAFHYLGSIQTGKLILELSDITIPENQLTMNGTWYVAHENASYYNVDNGSMQTMIGMLYNLVGGKLVCNLISSVLDGLAFQADGNIIARYAPLPDSVRIGSLIGNYIKHPANDWNASPPNLATYYVNDNTSLYVIPQSTTGIKMTIRESEDPAKGDLILLLDKSEIQELFALLEIVKVFIPEETLNAPVMDLIGNLIPPQFVSIAAILLKGKTFGAILNQLSQELNTIPIEIGIYLYKDKNIN